MNGGVSKPPIFVTGGQNLRDVISECSLFLDSQFYSYSYIFIVVKQFIVLNWSLKMLVESLKIFMLNC